MASLIDSEQAAKVVADLVRIESINPNLVAGGSGEGRIARHVAEFLKAAGLETTLQEIGPERANVIGVLHGRGGAPTLMLNGHLDTVGVEGMDAPFAARVEDGRLYGRGALDMKGGLAAAMLAVAALARRERLKGDVVLAAVADEEHESRGARALLRTVRADAAIVMEPTGLEVATAHKGFAWAEVETQGRAAHGSRPDEGRDAIAFMGRVLVEMERLQQKLNAGARHPLLGAGSIHASTIAGGQELSSYPARCRLNLERRLIPGEDASTLGRELGEIIDELSEQDPRFHAWFYLGYSARPLETPRESALARTVLECARRVVGPQAAFGTQTFWTDAALFDEAGIPSVVFGPGGQGLHSPTEYVVLSDVVLCAETLAECARAFCGG